MRIDIENDYMQKAVEAFGRRVIVVSPEFEILATTDPFDNTDKYAIIGKHCYEVYHNRSSPCEYCAVIEVKEKGKPALRYQSDQPFSSELLSCYFSYPIYTGEDITAYVSMDFDLPILDRLEEKLKHSNKFLETLILSAVDSVVAAEMTGKIFIFNDSAVEIFGYSVEEALNRLNVRDIYPGNTAKEVMKKLRSEADGGKGKLKAYQVDILAKNGELIPISLYASIIYEEGREVATIGFFHDLREKIQMEKDLGEIQLQLMQSEKMASLGKLAAGVAHQLNNPLGGITLFAKLILEEYELVKGAKEDIKRILKDAERCRKTVKELLEFSRQTRHLMQPHDINQAISRTLFLLENQSLFQNIEIVKDLAPSIPPIPSDIQQLNHLFMNIILNAAQAMGDKGKLTIKSYVLPTKDRVCIEISDTGPGISQDIFNHIFEPFFTTKEEGKGTGLGLSLAYSIVENHNGNIKAKSKPGEGASFIIELPLAAKGKGGDESGE